MTGLEKFNSVWKFGGQRGAATQKKYEDILFSIWKHHADWKEEGFQIRASNDRTIYRVIELAISAGLLIVSKKYLVGNHTRFYHKNSGLFDLQFRNDENKYGKWLIANRGSKDAILSMELKNMNSNVKIKSIVSKAKKANKKESLVKKIKYDISKLYKISDSMLSRYYNMMLELNKACIHEDLNLISFLYFDEKGLPSGRPYSYFCSTLNEKKKHKVLDDSMEARKDFLFRVGLGNYWEVYDIKSEVPRVNYLFHTGEWKDDNYDFYTEIVKDTRMAEYDGDSIPRGETKYTHYNDSMKQIFMRIYFGKGTDKQSYQGYHRDRLSRLDKSGLDYFYGLLENGEAVDFGIWQALCNSTRKIVGPSIGPLVFWYTFFIESEVRFELMNRGKMVYNVYDGFYYCKPIKIELQKLVKEKALFVYENYMKEIRMDGLDWGFIKYAPSVPLEGEADYY